MKITSKIEKEALANVRARTTKAVNFVVTIHELDPRLINTLRIFWSTKSNKAVIERSIAHAASAYLSQGRDLLEMSKPDRLWLLNEIESKGLPKRPWDKSVIAVRVCAWQLFLIICQSETYIDSTQHLIDFCLRKTASAQASLFNDSTEV